MGSAWIPLTILGCVALTASVSSKKIKCYYCQYQYSKLNSKAPINKNCLDRVDDVDIEKIDCKGTCYKQRGILKMGHQGVVRGCWEKDNKDAGKCTPVSETVGDLKYTRHCCKSNKCNDDSAALKTIKCYYCQYQHSKLNSKAPINENCLDQVDEDGIEKIECKGTCYKQQEIGKGGHQGVVRGCWEKDKKDVGKCTSVNATVGDFKYTLHCCKSNKCNGDSANSNSGLMAGTALIGIALLFHLRGNRTLEWIVFQMN